MNTARRLLPVLAGVIAAAYPFSVVPQTAASAEFAVATIKPSALDARDSTMEVQQGGGLSLKSVTLRQLIGIVYQLHDFQIAGGPGWVATDRFDIEAKPELAGSQPPVTDEQRDGMDRRFRDRMKALFGERFQLVVREETKEMPIYALVQARGGSRLRPTAEQSTDGRRGINMRRGILTGRSAGLENLASSLANVVGRPVVNRTGLEGKFDWKLEWTPEPAPTQAADSRAAANQSDLSGPSIFTALQEQLGLKLEAQRGPAPILVIDRVEKPSAN